MVSGKSGTGHGIVPGGILINPQGLVVGLPLFLGSQGHKVPNGAYAKGRHVIDIGNLNCQENQTPHNLFIQNISEAKDKKRASCEHIPF